MKNNKNLLILLRDCKRIEQLKQIHAQSITLGLIRDHQKVASKVLNCYTKLGTTLQQSTNVFNQIQNPDIVSWTCLINLHIQHQKPCKAFWMFSQMILGGLRPDNYLIVSALSACARKKDLMGGQTVHGTILRLRLGSEPIVGNAMIDMYCRNGKIGVAQIVFEWMESKDIASWTSLLNGFILCSDLGSARRVFDEMPERNSVSWTAMITGYVKGKSPVRGLEMFQRMKAEGKDEVTVLTVVSVLSGCADIGALDLGRSVHGYVKKCNFGMDVTVNNALMDMYSKSGCLDMALKIFYEMRKRDVFCWTTLISGYAFHGSGNTALEVFYEMLDSGITPNEVTFVSVLSACSHAGMLVEGLRLFDRMVKFYGLKPKIEHYGCMVDLLGRAGLLEKAKDFIEQMHINPDAVIWRSLLSACLVHGNLKLAEIAGKMVIKLEPDDDGVYILLWNIYLAANRQEDALKIRKLMRNRKVKKKPGCSWVEMNGIINEFTAEEMMHHTWTEIYLILEAISDHSKSDGQYSFLDNHFGSG